MPENTTSTGTMGLLNESLSEVSAGAYGLGEDATRLLERFDRLTEKLFGDAGPLTSEYWDLMDIRLGLEALSNNANLVRSDADIAEDHAKGLAELVQAVERLRA